VSCGRALTQSRLVFVSYQVIFDVADRFPDVALGAIALVLFAGVGFAALADLDAVLARWPLTLIAGTTLLTLEALVDRRPIGLLPVVVPVVTAVGSVLYGRRMAAADVRRGLPPEAVATMMGIFQLVFAMGFGLPMISAIWLSQQLANGQAVVVEGTVTIDLEVFGKNECISVADSSFCYSDSNVTAGFNRTRALGGPIRNGLQVRISSIGDTIVRVEVAEEP
jgi:hypothetical protein